MKRLFDTFRNMRKKGVTAVVAAVSSTVVVGFTALAIDVGYVYHVKAELQRTADAAALAGASELANYTDGNYESAVLAVVQEYIAKNPVEGIEVGIEADSDVAFGRAVPRDDGGYDFEPTTDIPDAVRVTVRRTSDSPTGPVDLFFGPVLGQDYVGLTATATAMLVPRDIAIVVDLSASMNDDSELRHYKDTEINLYEIWANLPGGGVSTPVMDEQGFTSSVVMHDNGDGSSHVTISVTSDSTSQTKALSHITFGFPEGAWSDAVNTAYTDGSYSAPVSGTDPTTGLSGVKFDAVGNGLGEDGVSETDTFDFDIANEYLGNMQMAIATKAGQGLGYVNHTVAAGPTWGFMNTWGTITLDELYDPTSDAGLIHLPRYSSWSDAEVQARLQALGYNEEEMGALVSSGYDNSESLWRNRVGVVLGLALWQSGKDGGVPGGDGDDRVEDGEMSWVSYPYERGSWSEYIKNYVDSTGTEMYRENSDFRYRYGLKTYINYLLENRRCYHETADLWMTPEQPIKAVKDAVQECIDVIVDLKSNDKVSLETYDKYGRHQVPLTLNDHGMPNALQAIPDALTGVASGINARHGIQAGHYDVWTNIGEGFIRAVEELTNEDRIRPSAMKVIMILTDGIANVDQDYNINEYNGRQWAEANARVAADLGMRIYSITVGANADQSFMASIAEDIGHGEHFHAEGSIEQYTEQLRTIFGTLGGRRPVRLIE